MSEVVATLDPRIHEYPELLKPLRERMLANLVMVAQIPAPTGEENPRVRFLLDRFVESGLPEVGTDEIGNAVGLLPGRRGHRTIMLVAHIDSIFPSNVDHNVGVQADRVVGPGVGDNALGAAVISMMPVVLDELKIELDSDLLLLGSIHSLGRGNHEGIRFYLENSLRTVDFAIVVEGIQLGRLNYFSVGTLRGDITCDVREDHSRTFGTESALVVLNNIINRVLSISTPTRPYTVIRLGKMRAGVSYDTEPDHAQLGLEVVSHSDKMIGRVRQEIEDIVAEISARHAVDAKVDFFFSRQAGGIPFSHPLVKSTVEVMEQLGIDPDRGHSPSELSEILSRGVPAVTLGVTQGEKNLKSPDNVLIEPILRGVAQLVGVIQAIDMGGCDES